MTNENIEREREREIVKEELEEALYFILCSNTGITKKESKKIIDDIFCINSIRNYELIAYSFYTLLKKTNKQYYRIKEFEHQFKEVVLKYNQDNNISTELIDEDILDIELK